MSNNAAGDRDDDDQFYEAELSNSTNNISLSENQSQNGNENNGGNGNEESEETTAASDYNETGELVLPATSFKSVLLAFLKTLASASGDLSSITCPAVMISGTSLLEYSSHWADHPELLAATNLASDKYQRMVAVVRWFVSTLYGSYTSKTRQDGFEKKPYNPILGEQFFASWPDVIYGDTNLCCEQVSHHPPVTAFNFTNEKNGVIVSGYCGQKTKFSGTSIRVQQTGHCWLYLKNHNEEYKITYPTLQLRGLFTGSPFIELCKNTVITCNNGVTAEILYEEKPWFGGEYDFINGSIYEQKGKPLYYISGKWSGKSFITNFPPVKSAKFDASHVLFSAEERSLVRPSVAPVDKQNDLESRKVWRKVTAALMKGDYDTANKEKTLIEDLQRAMRKERAESNENWNPQNFSFVEYSFVSLPGYPKQQFLQSPENISISITAASSSNGSNGSNSAYSGSQTSLTSNNSDYSASSGYSSGSSVSRSSGTSSQSKQQPASATEDDDEVDGNYRWVYNGILSLNKLV